MYFKFNFNIKVHHLIVFLLLILVSIFAILKYKSNNELDYVPVSDSLRLELISKVDSLISRNAPSSKLSAIELVDKSLENDFDLIFMLAKAKLESNFGTSGLAKKSNSVWNIGAYDSVIESKVLRYEDPNDSIDPYILMIKSDYLEDSLCEIDLLNLFVNSNGFRYASNESYEKLLFSIYYKYLDSDVGKCYLSYKSNEFPE